MPVGKYPFERGLNKSVGLMQPMRYPMKTWRKRQDDKRRKVEAIKRQAREARKTATEVVMVMVVVPLTVMVMV